MIACCKRPEAIDWIEEQDRNIPIGIGSAGLIVPQTGIALTANLPATGKSFQKTLPRAVLITMSIVTFCPVRAIFGSSRKYDVVMGMILGTGGGGGVISDRFQTGLVWLAGLAISKLRHHWSKHIIAYPSRIAGVWDV